MRPSVDVVTPSDVFKSLSDGLIVGGEVTDEGMHLYLQDGRVLIFAGDFVVYVGIADKSKLQ